MSRSDSEPLDTLLRHPDLWRAGQLGTARETAATGHPCLDAHLPGGGWPRAGLAELLLGTAGVGELRLLVPLLRGLSREQNRWIAWIDPPFVPYAPALEAAGVDIRKILLIHPKNHEEALWALERASRCGTCSLTLAWLDERKLELTDTRRLQLAARQGHTLTCLFRPEAAVAHATMAELRLRLSHAGRPGVVTVDILKRRGGWPVSGLEARLSDDPAPEEIREQLSLWREYRRDAGKATGKTAGEATGKAAGETTGETIGETTGEAADTATDDAARTWPPQSVVPAPATHGQPSRVVH